MHNLIKAQNDAYIEALANLKLADEIINDIKVMRRYQRTFTNSQTLKSLEIKVDNDLETYFNQRKEIEARSKAYDLQSS